MIELILHLWGDYIIQNNWMATNKTKYTLEGWIACLVHCITYTLPFLLLTSSWKALLIIFITHFFIDKFRLAIYLTKLKNWSFTPTGFPIETPAYITFWLVIIIDNILHITINYLTLLYL